MCKSLFAQILATTHCLLQLALQNSKVLLCRFPQRFKLNWAAVYLKSYSNRTQLEDKHYLLNRAAKFIFEHSGNFFFKDVEAEAVLQVDTLDYCLKRALIPNRDGFPRVVFSTLSTSAMPSSIWSFRPCAQCPSKPARPYHCGHWQAENLSFMPQRVLNLVNTDYIFHQN